jgi:rsbT co-antagonist protein RsbR
MSTFVENFDALHAELAGLRARVAELEGALTQRDQSIAELGEQVEMYTQILDIVPAMVLVKGPQSRIVYANQAFRDYYGMTMEQLRGLIDAPFNEPNHTEQYLKDDAHVFTTGQVLDIPHEPITRHDGEVYIFHTRKAPIFNADGQVVKTVGITQNITERRETEEQLRQARGYNRQLVEQTPALIGGIAPDGTTNFINPALEQVTGYRADELIGQNWWTTFYPGDDYYQVEQLFAAFEHGDVRDHEMTLTTRNGAKRTIAWNSVNRFDQDGTLIEAVGFGNDITERKRAEQELRASQARFAGIVNLSKDAIILIDTNQRITLFNAGAEGMFGFAADEVLGQPLDILMPPDLVAPHARHVREFAASADLMRPMEKRSILTVYRRDGSRFPAEATISKLEINGEQVMTVWLRDITHRKRAEEERLHLQEEIIRVQEAALRELSTPLIPISDTVMVMPLIGAMDSRRAQQVIEELLKGIAVHHAQVAILDITGVPVVDTRVADGLIRAAQAVKLLGAQVILTGIRPEVAQTLVGLSTDLSGIITRSTLQSGIDFAMRRG